MKTYEHTLRPVFAQFVFEKLIEYYRLADKRFSAEYLRSLGPVSLFHTLFGTGKPQGDFLTNLQGFNSFLETKVKKELQDFAFIGKFFFKRCDIESYFLEFYTHLKEFFVNLENEEL